MDRQEVLESRLRHQEDMLARYQSQLDRTKTELDIARREAASLRTQLADSAKAGSPLEPLDASFRATAIEFSSLMTGGINLDGQPGDDGLAVVLVPEGPDGELVRLSGAVEIEAFDVSHPEGAERIGHWKFDAGESQQYWHNGVIQSGYQFELPWQAAPQTDKLLLHGRIVAIDGRQFDTTCTVRIEPPPASLASQRAPSTGSSRIESTSAVSTGADTTVTPAEGSARPFRPLDTSPTPFGHADAPRAKTRSQARSLTGREFEDRIPPGRISNFGHSAGLEPVSTAPLSGRPQPRPSSPVRGNGAAISSPPFDPEPTPRIEDAPEWRAEPDEDDSWYRQSNRPPVRTSDSWTGESIPYLR